MNWKLEQRVRNRARGSCEYCKLPERYSGLRFPLDHIIAQQHGGSTTSGNLALACGLCNRHKGPNISGIDPLTRKLAPLFNPRRDKWNDHFSWRGVLVVGRTAVGRATVQVLALNLPERVLLRQALATHKS